MRKEGTGERGEKKDANPWEAKEEEGNMDQGTIIAVANDGGQKKPKPKDNAVEQEQIDERDASVETIKQLLSLGERNIDERRVFSDRVRYPCVE